MSAQKNWQERKRAAGCCILCGKPREFLTAMTCNACRERRRLAQRAQRGCKPRAPGGRGRLTIEERWVNEQLAQRARFTDIEDVA